MFLNNSFNILPWYDSLEKQSSKKWYAFGQSWPLLCPKGVILPFQFVCEALEVTSNIQAVNVNTNEITDLGIAPSVIQGSQPNSTYYIVKLASATVPALSIGTYYLRFNTSLGYLYSEEITIIDDSSECIKIQYWNEDTLNFASGEINFADDFKFEFYIRSTIGKPEYEFEEELTKRLGYKFIESQTSNKVYKFAFVAPEYICDAMRLIRLCDYVKLTTKFDSYNALSFAYEPKWQDQGDLAAVDVEFDTDCIIQKLESFNRRIKESFYNALLADIDEPVLFSTDTVAQYYTEFTTTSFINGKLIRQLESILPDELQSDFANLVLPIDNMADDKNTAKKVSLPDLMSLVTPSDISKLFKGHFDADGNLLWIEALSHIGVNGGVTMFIDNGTMSLPQLYSGLPIDGKTLIRDDNGVLMINPDIDLGGGVSNFWDLSNIPSWITATKPKYSYSEIEYTPDLSVYVKSSVLTSELAKYVTLGVDETISGLKDFTKGLKISGLGISKSQDDVIYIDANLVVRGGITMYAEGSVDIPSILDSLPIASTTAKGIASFDSSYFSVDYDGKVTLLAENVGLNEAELATYLSNNGYATQAWVNSKGYALSADLNALQTKVNDFLEGSDTDTIINKWLELEAFLSGLNESDNLATILSDKANKATTLAGYGITDAYTKSAVDTLLGNYVTLGTTQTITGEKNFTGGLKVNGSPIVYDSTNKYWKLEGDLLVTGGVTMYANEGTYTPSTIMDGLVLDSATLGINDEGRLYVKGGAGGGLTEVYWDDVKAKPTFATVATSGKYSDLSGVPTLLSSFTNDVGYLTSHQTIYNLTLQAGSFSAKTFDPNGAAMTVNIPTTTSHISEGTNLYFTNARAVSALSSTLSNYLLASAYTASDVLTKLKTVDGSGSGLDADLLDGTEKTAFFYDKNSSITSASTLDTLLNNGAYKISRFSPVTNSYNYGTLLNFRGTNTQTQIYIADGAQSINSGGGFIYVRNKFTATESIDTRWITLVTNENVSLYNAGSATKLQTARTIWGQSFDGTGSVSGALTGVTDITASGTVNISTKATIGTGATTLNNTFNVLGSTALGGKVTIFDSSLANSSNNHSGRLYFNSSNYDKGVFIQGINVASYGRKRLGIFVNNEASYNATTWVEALTVRETGNVGIGTPSPTVNLQVNGSARVSQIDLGHGNEINGYTSDNEVSPTNIHINYRSSGNVTLAFGGGNVGIGTKSPSDLMHLVKEKYEDVYVTCTNAISNYSVGFGIGGSGINRGIWDYAFSKWLLYADADKTNLTNNVWINQDMWDNGLILNRTVANSGCGISVYNNGTKLGIFGISGSQVLEFSVFENNANSKKFTVDKNGNGLFYGGVTMYSDIRKKTKLQDVELSLSQIANAPLIEYYYNSDDKRTTHVGSIAQYWAGLNDWFCKLDNEGFYTMEIQNAALASAISIARELSRYESKTDKEIRLLKDEVKRLKKEIKILKSA